MNIWCQYKMAQLASGQQIAQSVKRRIPSVKEQSHQQKIDHSTAMRPIGNKSSQITGENRWSITEMTLQSQHQDRSDNRQ